MKHWIWFSATRATDTFICKRCTVPIDDEDSQQLKKSSEFFENEELTRLYILCSQYKKSITLDDKEKQDLESKTRDQSEDALWHTERCKRVTASYFGKIYKARGPSTYTKIVNEILIKSALNTPAIRKNKRKSCS